MLTRTTRLLGTPLIGALIASILVAAPAQAAVTVVTTWEQFANALASGETIRLGADISGGGVKVSEKNGADIDLAGHDVKLTGKPAIELYFPAVLKVRDSVGGGAITAEGRGTDRQSLAAAVVGTRGHDQPVSADDQKLSGTIEMWGGTLNAYLVDEGYAQGGAAIGGGSYDHGGGLNILGGATVIADSSASRDAAAIGGGVGGSGSAPVVYNGTIDATGSDHGAAIGGGSQGHGGGLTVHAGSVTAKAGSSSAAIGGGLQGHGGETTLAGGKVTAIAHSGSAIGAGMGGGRGSLVHFVGGDLYAEASRVPVGGQSPSFTGPGDDPGQIVSVGKVTGDSRLPADDRDKSPFHEGNRDVLFRVMDTPRWGSDQEVSTLTIETITEAPFEVDFDMAGGTPELETMLFAPQDSYLPALTEPTRDGYDFTGWYDGGDVWDSSQPITKHMTLTAGWKPQHVTVTFDSAGGEAVESQTIRNGGPVFLPSSPSRVGYNFDGWHLDGERFEPGTRITQDTTLVAKWKVAEFNVTFMHENGTGDISTRTVKYGDKAVPPDLPPYPGYELEKWVSSSHEWEPETPITRSLTLHAKWTPVYHLVSFDAAGGAGGFEQTVWETSTVREPSAPIRNGYEFAGWQLDGKPYDFTTPVTKPITLTATWKLNTYNTTFDSQGGSAVASKSVEHGKTLTKPANPTRSGFTFTGWQLDGKPYDFATAVNKPVSLTATWKAEAAPAPTPTETPKPAPKPTQAPEPKPAETPEPAPQPVAKTTPVNLVDVSSNKSAANYTQFHWQIQWLANTGITKGWSVDNGKHEFRPKEEITREAMAAFMYRYAGSPDVKLPAKSPFKDVTPQNTNFYKEIVWMNQQGISTGWSTSSGKEFRPKDEITRDAMAAFMYRFADKPAFKAPATSPFADVPKSSQFYKEITWLANAGISTGWTQPKGKPEYRPYNEISREAMAAFLYRLDRL